MCELFGMSSRFPTHVRVSFEELARHGGGSGPHRDGWGLALCQDGDALIVREADAANGSDWVRFIQSREQRTTIAIAHIRKATQGARRLSNTQPFARELAGRIHVFAHNGMLPGIEGDARFVARRFRRIGDTDSEQAFCALLERLAPLWERGEPELSVRLEQIRRFARELRSLGPANFIYTDGDVVFVHGHRRMQACGTIRAPGLHVLCRTCSAETTDAPPLAGIAIDHAEEQRVALVASVPLSSEPWAALAEGEIVVLRAGQIITRDRDVDVAELAHAAATAASTPALGAE
jgi:predicted glutamine amidotransferase